MLTVELLQVDDFDRAYAVFNKVTSTNWTYSLFMQSAIKGHSVVAKKDEQVVGYCICSKVLDELSIEDIAVSKDFLRQGVAKEMLTFLANQSIGWQVNSILLEVRRSNKPARNLYKRSGYELVAERKAYYPAYKGAEKEDALVLKYLVA
jgi:ribosomal-protein-alanine N-acetyltransferase